MTPDPVMWHLENPNRLHLPLAHEHPSLIGRMSAVHGNGETTSNLSNRASSAPCVPHCTVLFWPSAECRLPRGPPINAGCDQAQTGTDQTANRADHKNHCHRAKRHHSASGFVRTERGNVHVVLMHAENPQRNGRRSAQCESDHCPIPSRAWLSSHSRYP